MSAWITCEHCCERVPQDCINETENGDVCNQCKGRLVASGQWEEWYGEVPE